MIVYAALDWRDRGLYFVGGTLISVAAPWLK